MPFFVPRRLIDFEYLGADCGADCGNETIDEEARIYQREMDLAFFVANFGFSKREYEDLTITERSFVLKAWEEKTVRETQLINNAVYNAICNGNRKKGRKYQKLWKKKPEKMEKKSDDMKALIQTVLQMEQEQGKDWVLKIRRR